MNSYKTVNKSELNLIRIFLLVCGIITPIIFVFFKDVIQEPHIIMLFDSPYSINISQTTNITFALLTLGLWALTYYSLFVRRYISWFIFGLIFLGTNGLLFHIFNPIFSIEELFLLYIVIFFSTLIFKNIYQIISFNIYIFAFLIIKFSHLRDDEVSVNI